jgi:hypothetical protein
VVIDSGFVAGISVVGAVVAAFTLSALAFGVTAMVVGAVASGATLTEIPTNLTEATNDHYNGRYLTFTSGALLGQSSDITAYKGASKNIYVTALTEAPDQGVTFVIT